MNGYAYRRGSIFWALTLIAVGALFLYQNFNPSVHPWQIIGKFWPVLIIFWGFSKLIDYIQARAHPEKVAPPLFTASEVILLLLILAAGTLISKIALRPWHHWPESLGINVEDEDFANLFQDSFTSTRTISRVASPQPRLLIGNRRGDVEVRPSDRATLEGVVKTSVRADSEDAAKKISNELKIGFTEKTGRYVFESNLDSLPQSGRTVRLDLSLRVPKATSAEISTERGTVVIEGLRGDQEVTTRRGDAQVSNAEGLVRIHKSGESATIRDVKGNVEIDGRGSDIEVSNVTGLVTVNGDFSGAERFSNVGQVLRYHSTRTVLVLKKLGGRLTMELRSLDASGVAGPFELTTRQKDITLNDFRNSVKITDTNGNVQLRTAVAPTHPIEVELKNGNIDLALPAACNFQIDASSSHGEVECEFSGLKATRQGDIRMLTGTYGKGGPAIRLSTTYGTIRLIRAGARPVPPSGEGEKETTRLSSGSRSMRQAKAPAPDPPCLRARVSPDDRPESVRVFSLVVAGNPAVE